MIRIGHTLTLKRPWMFSAVVFDWHEKEMQLSQVFACAFFQGKLEQQNKQKEKLIAEKTFKASGNHSKSRHSLT